MPPDMKQARPYGGFLGQLRPATMIALVGGAMGSVTLMLRAGHAGQRTSSNFLLLIFAVWVVSPFVVLAWANIVSKAWSAITRMTLYIVTIVLAVCSLAVYGIVALGPPRAKTAPVFVVLPPASWLIAGIAVLIAALISGRRSRLDDGDSVRLEGGGR
jgi:hypothetical protein